MPIHSLADKIAESGQRMSAGMSVRVLDIRADAGAGMGVFEDIQSDQEPGDFAQAIKRASASAYGQAGPAFVAKLIEKGPLQAGIEIRTAIDHFVRHVTPAQADGQVRRAAHRFGLVAIAGELAISLKILTLPPGTANGAAQSCFGDWLDARGGTGAAEVDQAKQRLINLLETHGASRFQEWSKTHISTQVYNRAGYVRCSDNAENSELNNPAEYFILPSAWDQEIVVGLDKRSVNATLVKDGVLIAQKDHRAASSHRPPSHGASIRLYQISPSFLSA